LLLGAADFTRLVNRRPDPGLRPLVVAGLKDLLPPPEGPADRVFRLVDGLTPEVTPNDLFYVVDEEVLDPVIDPTTWRLTVRGKVRRTLSIGYQDLLRAPLEERFQTLECISNEVGGDLMSTAKWVGAPLHKILARAGVDPSAVEVVFTASSGYADSLSIDQAMDDSTWVAVGMNDRVLPRAHGFPARLLSVGNYGMKNPKWLVDIEVADAPFAGYWEQRGWSKQADVKTGSRIDSPRAGGQIQSPVTVAGVAFAGDGGISRVEVSTDGRTWQPAELKRPLSQIAWRLWRYRWTPPATGMSTILVRAYDGRGEVQSPQKADPHPDGASGYHAITVRH
jgi:DMSO/TMAO reductase YedYZ molybdopterin-dependent catalytic subunit